MIKFFNFDGGGTYTGLKGILNAVTINPSVRAHCNYSYRLRISDTTATFGFHL